MECQKKADWKKLSVYKCYAIDSRKRPVKSVELLYVGGRLAQIAQKAHEKSKNKSEFIKTAAIKSYGYRPKPGKAIIETWKYRNLDLCMEKTKEGRYTEVVLKHPAFSGSKKHESAKCIES